MRYLLVFIILIFSSNPLTAQRRTRINYEDTFVVRFSPLGLLDAFDGNVTAGIAYTLTPRFTLGVDASYIFYSEYIHDKQAVYGYIVKPALRYYLSTKRRFFLEGAPFYKRVGYKVKGWLDKDVVNGVAAYQEFKSFTYRKQVVGLNLMAGVQKSLMRNNKLRLEIYAGISFRYKWQDIKNDPRASYDNGNFLDESLYQPKSLSPGIPHGLRVVYVIR